MVEEFMLLGNISVAKKILAEFPNCAILRRHPSPPVSNYDIIVQVAHAKVRPACKIVLPLAGSGEFWSIFRDFH